MPDTLQAVPISGTPEEQGQLSHLTATSTMTLAVEETPNDIPERYATELEVVLDPKEQQDIEGVENITPPKPILSNRERKRLLWLSKIPKKT